MKYIDNESSDQLNHCLVGLHTFQPTGTLRSVHPSSLTNVRLRSDVGREEGRVLFNDALNTFYLWLYDIGHMVKDHSDSEKGNPLAPTWATLFN